MENVSHSDFTSTFEADHDLDVVILPGIPETGIERLEDGRWAYPGTAPDASKLLREHGLNVGWAHPKDQRATVEHKALEIWLPVLLFLRDAVASGAGEVVASLVLGLAGSKQAAEDARLHVEFKVKRGDGVKTFKASGRGRDVLKAMKRFDAHDD